MAFCNQNVVRPKVQASDVALNERCEHQCSARPVRIHLTSSFFDAGTGDRESRRLEERLPHLTTVT